MGKEQRKISPAVLEAYLLVLPVPDCNKSGDEEEIRLGRYYDKKFRKDYRKYIWKIKKPKRKFRLWMYYHFKICV